MSRGPLAAFTLASLVVGLAMMLPFEYAVTRALGVAALFAFVVSGVFLIADPTFLAQEEDNDGAGPDPGYRRGRR